MIVGGAAGDGVVLDFREVAPGGASRDMYVSADGSVDSMLSRRGPLSVAVPSESRGLAMLVSRWGELAHTQVVRPAFLHAKRGFVVDYHLGKALGGEVPEQIGLELSIDGRAAAHGERVVRRELARTLSRWGRTGGEDLHVGPGAFDLAEHVLSSGGILTVEDLASYEVRVREPIRIQWRDYTIVTMPPPSSGGVALSQMLLAIEDEDLTSLGHNSSAYLHRIVEAMKHAYADRAHHLGDPEFVDVPVERLLSSERIEEMRSGFDPDKTHPPEFYGSLIAPPADAGTQHISVLDADGMAVALTTTINMGFGSGLVVPETGVVLNDEMDDFSAKPGVPNAYGLVGNEANAIAPGKRPLSSMTPTVVLDGDGQVVFVVGASGGSTIITGVFQSVLNRLVFGMDAADAVAAGRVHHQWQPDRLLVEGDLPRDVVEGLELRGHEVVVRFEMSTAVQAVAAGEDGVHSGGADPRKGGHPVGAW